MPAQDGLHLKLVRNVNEDEFYKRRANGNPGTALHGNQTEAAEKLQPSPSLQCSTRNPTTFWFQRSFFSTCIVFLTS